MTAASLTSTRPNGSIRRRIVAAALAVLMIAACLFTLFLYDYARRAADNALDRLLGASALSIAGAVQVDNGLMLVELPYAALAMLGASGDRVFYQVLAPDRSLVTGYVELGNHLPRAQAAEPVFENISYRGETMRVATVGRLTSTREAAGWATIRVAETRRARDQLAAEIFSRSVAPLIALLLVALGLIWFGIKRAFAPLAGIERELTERSPQDFSPLDAPAPVEVRQLVTALNEFMRRLGVVMERLRGVVADAAHQVRTPLASLRAQAEVALDETDFERLRQRVVRIHKNAEQASDVVNRLLMDATVMHRLEVRDLEVLSITTVIEDARQRLDTAQARRLAISIAPDARAVRLPGDRLALREMLINLIDNALLYGGDSTVDIGAAMTGRHRLTLTVADRGPGVPDDEKALVLERFQRGRDSVGKAGSGLGLAIVRGVAEGHGGSVTLNDRPGGGLEVRVDLPVRRDSRRRRSAIAAPLVCALACIAGIKTARAAETMHYPGHSTGPTLSILGTTDTLLFEALIRGFQLRFPHVNVLYIETDTLPLYRDVVLGRSPDGIDLTVSSAADLQVKLANDGFALSHSSPYTAKLPSWARWRDEVFGFTFEPAVLVYNRDLLPDAEVPRTHLGLTELLEQQPGRFHGRVGTYDIAASGVGHMLAAQDAQISSNFWRLTSAFGRVSVHVSPGSWDIIDQVERGDLAIGHNVLGSYAQFRLKPGSPLGVVILDDYTLVLTRALLIPSHADNPDLARLFIDFTLSPEGQAIVAENGALGAIMPPGDQPWQNHMLPVPGVLQPIALGPALMVSLDQTRKARFLDTWRQLVSPP